VIGGTDQFAHIWRSDSLAGAVLIDGTDHW
jgi:hypothetical protein